MQTARAHMTIEKIVHADGEETIIIRVGDLTAEMTFSEWAKLIANPKVTKHPRSAD